MKRLCISCGDEKDLLLFPVHHYNKDGIPVYRNQCNSCRQRVTGGSFTRRRRTNKMFRDNDNAKNRARRQDPAKRVRFILEDSRKSDKKKNRENDLTKEFVENAIRDGCSYCGEKEIKICLDRKDNSRGHTEDNVVAACVRCNYIRNSMPYEAWLYMVPIVKEVRLRGLFSDWKTRFW